jgi:heat-inducible transcriptional repressor
VDDQTLPPRRAELLRAVCRAYMLGGDDVPSAALAREYDWSPATIRGELAALEKLGLVDRAHRSAGCRPTRKGLELYVASRPRDAEPPIGAARAVERSLAASGSVEQDLRASARVLAEIGGCVAVSFVADPGRRPVRELELVPLSATRLLVVVGFEGGETTMHPVGFDDCPSVEQLTAEAVVMQSRLREFCIGRTLVEAHVELVRVRDDMRSRLDGRLAEVVRLGLSLCAGGELDPLWLSVAGQARLARGLGASSGDGVSEVLARLEDDRRLAELLCRLLPVGSAGEATHATVVFGDAALLDRHAPGPGEPSLRLALVGCRLPATAASTRVAPNKLGAIAVLGSDRMDYASVIPLVEYAARALAART